MTTTIEITQVALSRKINELADVNEQIRALTARADALKADFRAYGDGLYESGDHAVTVITRERKSLSTPLVKAILTPRQIEECTKVTQFIEVCVA